MSGFVVQSFASSLVYTACFLRHHFGWCLGSLACDKRDESCRRLECVRERKETKAICQSIFQNKAQRLRFDGKKKKKKKTYKMGKSKSKIAMDPPTKYSQTWKERGKRKGKTTKRKLKKKIKERIHRARLLCTVHSCHQYMV